jgi:hypothetical protein
MVLWAITFGPPGVKVKVVITKNSKMVSRRNEIFLSNLVFSNMEN